MNNYSIIRIGKEYVVQADEKSILKIASRRRAARLVSDAAELLELPAVPRQPDAGPSNDGDSGIISDPEVIPDPRAIPDPQP
jgi:hypothetical protein